MMYIDPYRFNVDDDPYAQYVVSLLRFNETVEGASPVDETGKTWTSGGSPNPGGLYGYSRVFGSGSSGVGYITTPNIVDVDLDMGVGDFTLEVSIKYANDHDSAYATVVGCNRSGWGAGAALLAFAPGTLSRLDFYVYEHYIVESTEVVNFGNYTPNVWNRYALVREGTNIHAFLNGVLVATKTGFTYPINFGLNGMAIGSSAINNITISGRADEFRLTKGIARYTNNYDVGSMPFPPIM